MTIYSGKDVNVYLGDQPIAYANLITYDDGRVKVNFEDYQGNIHTYKTRPKVTGSISLWDIGLDFVLNVFRYKEVDSTTEKLLYQHNDEGQFSIGNYKLSTTLSDVAYNGSSLTQLFDLPSGLIGTKGTFEFKQIAILVGGVGTPNSEVYRLSLYEDSTERAFTTFTWDTNDVHWEYFDANYEANATSNWKIILSTTDVATGSSNGVRWYKTTDGKPPYLNNATNQYICNININDWFAPEQTITLTAKITGVFSALFEGVTFGGTGREYAPDNLGIDEVPFTAKSMKMYQE